MINHKEYFVGLIIGRLEFIEYFVKNNKGYWKTKCQCGNEQDFSTAHLWNFKHRGSIFECFKCKHERKSPTLTDKVFGRLTVLKEVPGKDHHRWWLCKCECGVEKAIPSIRLTGSSKKNKTKSCGCLARKLQSKWVNTTQYPPSHGLKSKNVDEIENSLYYCRNSFVAACYNSEDSRFHLHGKKGHTVCDLWRNGAKDFVIWAKKNNYKPGDAVYLKLNKKEFSPKNCYIQSKKQYNKINNSKFIEYKGKSQSITDWSKELNCTIGCLSQRLKKYKNYGIEKIFDLSWTPPTTRTYGTENFEDEIIELYNKQFSYQEICEKLGCSSSTILRYLNKNNIVPRSASCRSATLIKNKISKIKELRNKGMSFNEISKELNIKYASMMYHYRKEV